MGRNIKYNVTEIEEFCNDKNFKCINIQDYENCYTKLAWLCDCGNEWEATFHSIKNGKTGCPKCKGGIKLSYEAVDIYCNTSTFTCLNSNYYINATSTNLEFVCKECGELRITSFNTLKANPSCPNCNKIKKQKKIADDFYTKFELYFYDRLILLSDYISSSTPIYIYCVDCGNIFKCRPDSIFYQKFGCKKCAGIFSSNKQTIDLDFFKKESSRIHNNKYDYSLVIKLENKSPKIPIICLKHDIFMQSYHAHLKGQGCKMCSIDEITNKQRLTNEIVIERGIALYGEEFGYDRLNYTDSNTQIEVLHKKCNRYIWVYPQDFFKGQGCILCTKDNLQKKRIMTLDHFIERARKKHGNKYIYDRVKSFIKSPKYVDIEIYCTKCKGWFWQNAANHLQSDHYKCGRKRIIESQTLNTNIFIERSEVIHGKGEYDYTKSRYTKAINEILIKHNVCGKEFYQQAYSHMKLGCGCPFCNSSKGEISVRKFLNRKNIKFEEQFKFEDCIHNRQLIFDFYIPYHKGYKIVIETDGPQHDSFQPYFHSTQEDFIKQKERNSIKNKYCKENNIKLLRIKYKNWNNIEKILESYLTNI